MKMVLSILIISAIILPADILAALAQARAAMNRGDFVNAEQILTAAIREGVARPSKTKSALDEPLEVLAQVYQREKKFPEAAATQKRRVDLWTAMFGDNAIIVGRVLGQLALAERPAGNLADAETHSRRALAIMTAAYDNKPPAAQAAIDLADLLIAQDRTADAEQMLALAQKTFDASIGPESTLTIGVATRRAQLLRQLGRALDADQLAQPSTPVAYRIGGTGQNQVLAPRILSKIEAQYSEEARKKKLQGSILVNMIIDATGTPTQIAILRPLGMGLDEMAVAAVSQWRFAPGSKEGTPIPVLTQIEVTFRLL